MNFFLINMLVLLVGSSFASDHDGFLAAAGGAHGAVVGGEDDFSDEAPPSSMMEEEQQQQHVRRAAFCYAPCARYGCFPNSSACRAHRCATYRCTGTDMELKPQYRNGNAPITCQLNNNYMCRCKQYGVPGVMDKSCMNKSGTECANKHC